MTKEQLAAKLNGREYRSEITKEEAAEAKAHGLVVVFGASDDLMEFRGAIDEELDAYEGTTAYLSETGIFEAKCEDEDCPYAEKEREKCKAIKQVWCGESGASWEYETDIPHATFNIMDGDEDELYCVGIVFEIYALAATNKDG